MKIFKKNKIYILFTKTGFFFKSFYGIHYQKILPYSQIILKNFNQNNMNNYYFFFKKNLKLFKSLIKNLKNNLELGCFLEINVIGIGYKCWRFNINDLLFNLGYSHYIYYKNQFNIFFWISRMSIKCFSFNIFNLGLMVAEIISLRIIDDYKGKGLKLSTTVLNLKKGKQR